MQRRALHVCRLPCPLRLRASHAWRVRPAARLAAVLAMDKLRDKMVASNLRREGYPMLIRVQYADNSYDQVDGAKLDSLIATNSIIGFKRSNGWVRPGIDPVRTARSDRRQGEACLEPQFPNDSRCRTYRCYDDLWLCLVDDVSECPYTHTVMSERFCTSDNAARYKAHGGGSGHAHLRRASSLA